MSSVIFNVPSLQFSDVKNSNVGNVATESSLFSGVLGLVEAYGKSFKLVTRKSSWAAPVSAGAYAEPSSRISSWAAKRHENPGSTAFSRRTR